MNTDISKAVEWLAACQPKMYNPMLEDIISSIECSSGFDITAITNLFESDIMRGPNKPPKKGTVHHQSSCNLDGGKYFHESNVGCSKNYGTDDNCNHNSYQYASDVMSQTTVPTAHPGGLFLNYNDFAADDCERDNCHGATMQSTHKTDLSNANLPKNNIVSNDFHPSFLAKDPIRGCGTRNPLMHSVSTGQKLKRTTPLNTGDNAGSVEMPVESKPQQTVETSFGITADCYKKLSYAVLVGNTVRTCNTKLYASLPLQNKYMVKQRVQDTSGATRIKLILKSSHIHERLTIYMFTYINHNKYYWP